MRNGWGLGQAVGVGGWQAMVVQQHRSGGGTRAVCALAVMGVMVAATGCAGDGGSGDGAAADERSGAAAVEAVRRSAAVLAGRGAGVGSAEVVTSMETAAGGTRVTIRGKGTYD